MHFCIKVLKCSSRAMWRLPAWRITPKSKPCGCCLTKRQEVGGGGRGKAHRACTHCASMSPIIMVLLREPEQRIMRCVRIESDSRITLLVRPVLVPQASHTHTHIRTPCCLILNFLLWLYVCECVWRRANKRWRAAWLPCRSSVYPLSALRLTASMCACLCMFGRADVWVWKVVAGRGEGGVGVLPNDGWVAAATHVADALGHHCWQQYQRQLLQQQQQ